MLPDKMEHCIVFMNSWDVSDVFWSFSKCNITIPHFPTVPSIDDAGHAPAAICHKGARQTVSAMG